MLSGFLSVSLRFSVAHIRTTIPWAFDTASTSAFTLGSTLSSATLLEPSLFNFCKRFDSTRSGFTRDLVKGQLYDAKYKHTPFERTNVRL